MTARHAVILGGASEIAEQAARSLASRGYALTLCGRHVARLEDIAADLCLGGARECRVRRFDAASDDPGALLDSVATAEPITDCLIAQAQPQPGEMADTEVLVHYFRVNCVTPIVAMQKAAERIAGSGQGGTIAWLSSPAALRGRRVNWLYGASKAGPDIALEGMAGVYRARGVRMLCLRPGPTRTGFNEGMTPSPLWATSERVGSRVAQLIDRGAEGQRFIPGFWWLPALVLRALPRRVLMRLRG